MKLLALLALFTTVLVSPGYGYKILGVFPTMARSHYIVGSSLMKGLAEKGHDVTVLSPFHSKPPMKNYREIDTPGIIEATKGLMLNLLDMKNQNILQSILAMFDLGIMLTNSTFNEKSVQDLIRSDEKFDLVIMEIFVNEAMLGFAHHFNAPVIGVSTFGASKWTCDLVGSPSPPSYVPHAFLSFSDQMGLVERIGNLAVTALELVFNNLLYIPKQEELYDNFFPDPKPTLRDLMRNVSLILLNTHFTLNYPRPYAINMIEVGGMHINRQTNPLPVDIQQFLDSAKYGAIYFSMGSNIKSVTMPKEKIDAILAVFRSLKQKVLWKWEDKTLQGKSDNILINPWFPQDDILAHPNVKLFITHGGLLSSTEAVYHGVPIIAIPIFGDQYLNAARAVKAGFGLSISFDQLDSTSLKSAITEILSDKKYSENMQKTSSTYRDQPMTPLETAIHWVEYIARHKGAPHMHSAGQELSFIQYHNLDVFAVIFGGLTIIYYLIKFIFSELCKTKSDKFKKSVQKNKKYQ